MGYKFLDHTGDIKFIAEGATLEEAFTESFLALKETICGKIIILEKETKEINLKEDSLESLLYRFLEEFLVLLDSQQFLPAKIEKIKINEKVNELNCTVSGDLTKNYKFTNDVKAITYSDIFIKKEKDKWLLQIVVDV